VKLLLDTHAVVWWDEGTLDPAVVSRIRGASEVLVSAAVGWEIAIKSGIGKLTFRAPTATVVAHYGFTELPIRMDHADAVQALPRHHGDPFDRILVAQAMVDDLVVCTKDPIFTKYGVRTAWT
jgi:PIN domain nuclease of toxin-antitoxin system